MSSDSEEEQADLNMLDFNDPVVIHTLRITMMEIMENEHTEKPLQQSRSRTTLRGTHTIRSISYPYRKHSKSRVDTTRGRTLPMLEEQPEEELRQMGEPLLGNYLLDYARRRVYICLSTSIVRNNYFILKQAMHKDLHLNDRSADKLRRIWDDARSEYHIRLTQASNTASQQTDTATGSHSQARSTRIRPATASHKKSKIPTLKSRSKQATERTKRETTRTSAVDINVSTDVAPNTTTVTSSEKKLHSTRGSRIFESELNKDGRKIESDFWYPPEKTKVHYEYKPSTRTEAKVNTTETSRGHVFAEEKSDNANFSSSPETARMNPEEQESGISNLTSPEQMPDDIVISDIRQGVATLQLNEPDQSGSKKKVSEASRPSCSGTQYEKYDVKGDSSSDGLESIFFRSKAKTKKKGKHKKSGSSSSISTDLDIRYKQEEKESDSSSDPEERAEKLVQLFREKRRQPGQLLQPPRRVTSKHVQDAAKKSKGLLHLEDVYHYPRSSEKKLTKEQYEKRVREAKRGRLLREYMHEVEKERKILQQKLAEHFELFARQTTGKQQTTVKQRQSHFPQARLFLGEIEYPPPFEMYNLYVRRPEITPVYTGTCEYCRMMFGGRPPIMQTAQAESDEKSRRRRMAQLDPFLMPPGRRRAMRQEIEEEQKKKIEVQKKKAQEREARKKQAKHRKDFEQYKKDLLHGLPGKAKDYYPELRQLSPDKEFCKQSEAEGVTHMVSPPRSIMRPAWFPEKIPFEHQPRHIDNPPLKPWFQERK